MKFQSKSEKEIKEMNLLPAGEYDAEIGTAEDQVSQKGNEMIKLDVTVFDAKGGRHFVFDYLLEAMAFKLRHAAEACGLLGKYETGLLTSDDFIGKGCRVKLKIDVSKDGKYPDKNVIADYVVELREMKNDKTVKEDLGDAIPF